MFWGIDSLLHLIFPRTLGGQQPPPHTHRDLGRLQHHVPQKNRKALPGGVTQTSKVLLAPQVHIQGDHNVPCIRHHLILMPDTLLLPLVELQQGLCGRRKAIVQPGCSCRMNARGMGSGLCGLWGLPCPWTCVGLVCMGVW